MLRLYGVPEAEIAQSLLAIEGEGVPLGDLEITTCLRRGEIEIATVFDPAAAPVYDAFAGGHPRPPRRHAVLRGRRDDRRAGRGAARRADDRGRRVLHGRADGRAAHRPRRGRSAYVLGGVVVYSNEAKVAFADVPTGLIEAHGAVSPEVAAALADGACARFGAELGIGITGVAGPGGGTPEKPVGTGVPERRRRAGGRRGGPHGAAAGDRGHGAGADDDRGHAHAAVAARVSVRLFVALDLPAEARAALAAFRDEAADPEVWRPVPEASFHVTLAFIGHREADDVARARRRSRRSAFRRRRRWPSAGRCCCRGCSRWRWRIRRAGWAGPGRGERRARACGRLRAGGAPVPAARDRRRGCARARGRRGGSPAHRSRVAFRGGPVVLYRSVLGRGPANYERLWSSG